MKKIFSIFLVLSALSLNAQTIHWLTFVDTEDLNVGQFDVKGREVLYGHFINTVNAALQEKGYQAQIHDYYGSNMNPESCLSAVKQLKCSSNDIVVFYYIGHGTHAKDENNPYPQMLLGCDWDEEDKFINLKSLHESLINKNARLTVSIGMCCNVVQGARAKSDLNFSVNYGNSKLTDTELNAIQDMFLGYTGNIIVSSASVGQSSYPASTPFGDIDLFTAMLVSIFESRALEGDLNWVDFFDEITYGVNYVSQETQTPFYESNLTRAQKPTVTKPEPNIPDHKEISDVNTKSSSLDLDKLKNDLGSCLDYLIDRNNSHEERVEMANALMKLFTEDAVVKYVSQDGNIIIDKEIASVCLGRLASSIGTLKVIPIDIKHNGSQITELKVKEVFKQRK